MNAHQHGGTGTPHAPGGHPHHHGHGGGHHRFIPAYIDLTALAVPDTMALLRPVLPEPPAAICEVGAGLGALSAALVEAGYQVTAVEPDPESAAIAAKRGWTWSPPSSATTRRPGATTRCCSPARCTTSRT
ncbi:hypothetical protein Athai_12620 [Actinocatenispora thailandica]|uniref:Methyltransferase type 11 domain-containing protein n=1 Tax=Actinocatenispora thailandica TaxID=227318 RepID=A0A7R7DL59_9ACTN|nr:hypothetical protein [Actinocatenispora thailandica]BCJ33759.1 hypothetical protein Athai_12620 [Actinocatenispora thailandica]